MPFARATTLARLILLTVLVAGIAACTPAKMDGPDGDIVGDPSKAGSTRLPPGAPVKVALLLPLTGDFADVGTAMQKAAEMAVFETGSKTFQLIPIDTQGTPEGALAAMEKAIEQKVNLVIGPLFSASVKAISLKATEANINVIAFSTDPSAAGGNVFLVGFLPKAQVDRIVSYAVIQGRNRFGMIAPDTPYGKAVGEHMQAAATKYGATVVATTFYDPEAKDISDIVKTFAKENKRQIDAVMIPEGGRKLQIVSSLLAFYDVDPDRVNFLGTGRWDDATIQKEPTLKGGWFASPPPGARAKFIARYKATHNANPPRIATLAYDSVALAAILAKDPRGPDYSKESILSASGFAGIDGIFRFVDGGLNERGLAVLEVTPEEFRMISPSPASFAATTNLHE